jgi:hypothetical protein
MGLTVTKENVRELLEARRLWLAGDRLEPIRIYPVERDLVTSRWEIAFHGSSGRQTTAGAITDDWFNPDGTAKEGYFLVDHA